MVLAENLPVAGGGQGRWPRLIFQVFFRENW